ncbi:helix-turn-helix domain-containing protein [Amycolatopsis methanolica]|uniref:Putative DNA-binding protein n=1 Tax=Amycolatopsis methanolica 239 TaxID=1068978 RepID=A0A076N6D1_AMYME|nr:helix-turn-helix transcriptional regulator [Amycolatopsis methanolica]AIJ26341.1 putative DNA-binding protein [Amycolatopsis methanolica 239]AIJ26400.1 putative DNA-binding protein [Amycolatopsis methanolica 239]
MTIEDRRKEFGGRLREYRVAAGYSGQGFAAALGWQQSKVSRIELGQQRITDSPNGGELQKWADQCGLEAAERDELFAELRALRLDEARWKNRTRQGHGQLQADFGAIERAARSIRVFETALVPGPAQTFAYALSVFRALAKLRKTDRDPQEAAAARMQRQAIMYDPAKDIQLLISEAGLRYPPPWVGEDDYPEWAEVMTGQIDRLLALFGMRSVQLRILPLGQPLPVAPLHGFWILDDLINIELLHTEVTTRDRADVAFYSGLFDELWHRAKHDDEARAILLTVSADYRRTLERAP